ncbi:MAG TPA: Gfo/Idh/MocA family oxidoreductase [Clostridiales bacterium]|nr:Gfo/Idh/MocA family oxidoreductase [Clostridiales bacterium]
MKVGIIGFGGRIRGMFKALERQEIGDITLSAITDIRNDEIKELLTKEGKDPEKVSFYEDPDKMMDNEELDGIMIGTRCSLHTKMAVKVLEKNIPLFLEKPVATHMDDFFKLKEAGEKTKAQAVISFPLRTSIIATTVKEIIDSGKIGTVEHVQAINNVPYGRVYFHHWYRDENETQGLFLQKATHDFDYINYLLGSKPVEICAMTSKQLFKGDKPAGLYCKDCDEYYTCDESPYVIKKYYKDNPIGEMCCYAKDTGNEDSGSALVRYNTGMHVSYSQNFFARQKAGARGARLFGFKGTLEFDWYTGEIKVFMHHTPRVDTYKFDMSGGSHFGGDDVLAENFIKVMQGIENSIAPLEAGLLSALMCIKGRQSAITGEFKKIDEM